MTDVKCRVQTCHYWGHGDICEANSIMVENTSKHASYGKMEVGSLEIPDNTGSSTTNTHNTGGNNGEKQAHRSEETCCKTFRPKSSQSNR